MMNQSSVVARVEAWLDDHATELVRTLADLVRIPSIIGSEGEAQRFMRDRYLATGLDVDVFEADRESLSRHSAFVDSGIAFHDRPNVVGVWTGRGGGRSLILNGHTDVVSPEPTVAWSYPPFDAVVVSPSQGDAAGLGLGRMYGRGALDMKAGVVANLFALRALKETGVRLDGDLILQSVIEEEAGGGGGTLACFERGYLADGFITTEPHWHDIAIAHPGILYFRIVVEGKSAHAGWAHRGINAAVEMAPLINMLGEWDRERAARLHYELFERLDPAAKRSCHLNVGVVRAGDWPSTVPGKAEIEVRMSFLPGESEAAIKREIAERVHGIACQSAWLRDHPPRIEFFGWHTEPWIQDESHPFIQAFACCVADMRLRSNDTSLASRAAAAPVLAGSTAGLDARFAGLYGVPAVVWGPRGLRAHATDEYVELDSVVEVARTLAVFALRWCGYE